MGVLISACVEIIASPLLEVEFGSGGRTRRLMVQIPLIINWNFLPS